MIKIAVCDDNPYELVDTICHEAYHAYQHCLVDMYNTCDEQILILHAFLVLLECTVVVPVQL